MTVTIKDIARRYGTTPSTVSRALRGASTIAVQTRERIKEMALEMGYRPSATARALVTGRTKRITFWTPAMGVRFFQDVAYQFHTLLQADGYEMMVGEFGPQLLTPDQALGMTRMDVDGVITFGGLFREYRGALEKNFPGKVPIVNMGILCEGELDYVHVDLFPAAVEAVRYLVKSGCKRIAHVHLPFSGSKLDARYIVYHQILCESGMSPELITVPNWKRPIVRQTIREYVQANGCPDGMFCTTDEEALAALRGLRDVGKKVPDDVRLVGCNGLDDLEYLDSPISTIILPMEEMCRLAWDFLKRRMKDPDLPQQIAKLKATFLVRQ